MRWKLLYSPIFIRSAKRLCKGSPGNSRDVEKALERLSLDPFHPALRTHKLKGKFDKSYACSVAYDLRIIFSFLKQNGTMSILLENIGDHDDMY
jgi:mRNA-degrading endonuclease YafQ of YafQ-DinJ toxin-antitoxin module